MIGYIIQYGTYGYDCWGKSEWCGWYRYDNKVYTDKEKLKIAIEEAEKEYKDREFDFYEVEII
jgi:hypothetical protein